ncbi:MAG: damage-inducible protein CinA [Gammaproteobacteria bacterium]|nr:damage-inducible protein CinA [Gammaproteobacteria bacterium]|tara:strand:- start:870 stop:1355 length:486 start_codon:yes stop_codon:yes gene_type:complete
MNNILDIVKDLMEISIKKGLKISSAESCTAGLISKYLTDLPGSSKFFNSGIIVYSNESKNSLLNVSSELISNKGAVSKDAVIEMSHGLIEKTNSDIVVSVSGVMGPSIEQNEDKVGDVWFCWSSKTVDKAEFKKLYGDRESNRQEAAKIAILGLYDFIRAL